MKSAPSLVEQNGATPTASNFCMRIQVFEHKHRFETTDFWPYYKHRLVWILIAAVVHAITSPILAAAFSCNNLYNINLYEMLITMPDFT